MIDSGDIPAKVKMEETIEGICNIGLFIAFWCACSYAIGIVCHTIQNLSR